MLTCLVHFSDDIGPVLAGFLELFAYPRGILSCGCFPITVCLFDFFAWRCFAVSVLFLASLGCWALGLVYYGCVYRRFLFSSQAFVPVFTFLMSDGKEFFLGIFWFSGAFHFLRLNLTDLGFGLGFYKGEAWFWEGLLLVPWTTA